MEQYISKNKIIEEIKRRRKDWSYGNSVEAKYKREECDDILFVINNIEVKDVDLEDSVKETLRQKYIDYTFKRHNIDPESKEGQLIYYAYMHGINQCLDKLNAVQKGEEV